MFNSCFLPRCFPEPLNLLHHALLIRFVPVHEDERHDVRLRPRGLERPRVLFTGCGCSSEEWLLLSGVAVPGSPRLGCCAQPGSGVQAPVPCTGRRRRCGVHGPRPRAPPPRRVDAGSPVRGRDALRGRPVPARARWSPAPTRGLSPPHMPACMCKGVGPRQRGKCLLGQAVAFQGKLNSRLITRRSVSPRGPCHPSWGSDLLAEWRVWAPGEPGPAANHPSSGAFSLKVTKMSPRPTHPLLVTSPLMFRKGCHLLFLSHCELPLARGLRLGGHIYATAK